MLAKPKKKSTPLNDACLTIRATSESGVNTRAECRLSFFTVATPAISNVKRHHDTVSFLQGCHPFTQFLDNSHILVAFGFFSAGVPHYFHSILPKVMPGSAAVLPSYMLWGTVSFNVPIHRPSRSFPHDLLQVRAADRSLQFLLAQTFLSGIHWLLTVVTFTMTSSGCSNLGLSTSSTRT